MRNQPIGTRVLTRAVRFEFCKPGWQRVPDKQDGGIWSESATLRRLMPVKPGQFDGPAESLFAGIGEERRISLARRSGELPVYCSRKHCAGLYNPRVEVESEQIRDPQANQFFACSQNSFQFCLSLFKGSAFLGLCGLLADAQ